MNQSVDLKQTMRVIEGFPGPGISYKDITTILSNPQALASMIDQLAEALRDVEFDYVLGVESRGFIVGVPVAYQLHKGFLMARKPGKLPGNLIRKTYHLEYGDASIEIDRDALPDGARVVIMDDLLATGGTAKAASELVEQAGGKVVRTLFLTELTGLKGREVLEKEGFSVESILQWEI
ncbi:MAG: adenine phosphoribosyltransferase [Peptoniphilaceae bacterium]|nr:adenine phosphoribosyltransferase [Peptoniphilaceae bacterium]MCI6659596.1 adenine phosphoribosyltransferase [Peptoniphilaceae bacterium]MDD7434298.1 adenine phosphoribosyltransferase [Peptoniphilaceae bacterium]MDY3075048.1 adenine phosphoribosyltransferase [Peptoniphilaceae bacterium]MDY3987699.1 adenine phosphoribosyltransferase [Peptoniphilaceae bacterium]